MPRSLIPPLNDNLEEGNNTINKENTKLIGLKAKKRYSYINTITSTIKTKLEASTKIKYKALIAVLKIIIVLGSIYYTYLRYTAK